MQVSQSHWQVCFFLFLSLLQIFMNSDIVVEVQTSHWDSLFISTAGKLWPIQKFYILRKWAKPFCPFRVEEVGLVRLLWETFLKPITGVQFEPATLALWTQCTNCQTRISIVFQGQRPYLELLTLNTMSLWLFTTWVGTARRPSSQDVVCLCVTANTKQCTFGGNPIYLSLGWECGALKGTSKKFLLLSLQ